MTHRQAQPVFHEYCWIMPPAAASDRCGDRSEAENEALSSLREEELALREARLLMRESECETLALRLQGLVDGVGQLVRERLCAMAPDIVSLALTFAENILQTTVTHNPETLVPQIQLALQQTEPATVVTIRLSPADLNAIKGSVVAGVSEMLANPHTDWRADPGLKAGEIFLDTNEYRLDASLWTALNNLKQDLKEVR